MVPAAPDRPVTEPAAPPAANGRAAATRQGAKSALTPQQDAAVARREVSVVLSSGAGCGKTHVLTERYLSHLRDDGAEVGQLVAITFTDRAARQMRERIRRALLQQLRGSPEEEAERWVRHLRGLETAQISTIHAFCAALLRQHAVAAGLDPHFEVLEDVLTANFQAEALTACLQELLPADSGPGEDLRELILLYGWRPVVEAVRHLADGVDEPAWRRWLGRRPDDIAAEWQGDGRGRLLPGYVDYLVAACPKVAQCLWLLRTTSCVGPQTRANVERLLRDTPRLATLDDLAGAVDALVEAAKVGKERAKAWPSEEAYEAVKKAFEGFRADLPERLRLFLEPPGDAAAAAAAGQRFLRVATEAVAGYRRLKRRAGALDFQDLLVLARDLLRDRPEVREPLQRRHRFLLIDELQDTDPVQMELVQHLCGGELTAGKLFAVGDMKQSIYRFRRADVHLFRQLRHTMPHEGRLDLTVNFRSQPAVLDFCNALFALRMQDYEPLRAHHGQVNPGACVEFLWAPRGPKENAAEARTREADWIARRVAAMVGNREALVAERSEGGGAKLRPARQGDVVLLFRAMSHVHLYEAALRRHGLDYYLVGGRAFFAQQEIYDLLNLLRALENPQDAVSLAGTLRSPFCCLSDEALFVLSRHPEGLWAGLRDPDTCARLPEDQRAAADRARRHLDRWRGVKDRLPIARLLNAVFADSGYDAAVQFEFLGDRKLANLWKLTDLARSFDRSGLFGLAEFIARLGDLVRTQPREEQAATQPESADVVRLMTIHQAKGLEFPVVFVPDLAGGAGGPHLPVAHWDARLGCIVRPPADEDPPPFSDFAHRLWKASESVEDWHEDLRALYVACTRAQDYLVLSAALPASFNPSTSWMLALAERFDLRSGACLTEGVSPGRVPLVRVVNDLEAVGPVRPPGPPEKGSDAGPRSGPDERPGPAVGPDGWPRAVAPVPVTLEGRRVFTVAEAEACLRGGVEGLEAEGATPQFDAEDGSDRSRWVRPGDGLRPALRGDVAALDRLVRAVLEKWDFRSADGWRPLLGRELAWLERTAPPGRPAEEAAALLGRFAASPWLAELAAARECRRGVEFLLGLGRGRRGQAGELALHGVIDFLWQGPGGDWHVLDVSCEAPDGQADRLWQRRRPGLVAAAVALRHQLGAWPKTVSLYHLGGGVSHSVGGRDLPHRKVLAALRAALTACARRRPAG